MVTINAILNAEKQVRTAREEFARAETRFKILSDELVGQWAIYTEAKRKEGERYLELEPQILDFKEKRRALTERISNLQRESNEFHALMKKAERQSQTETNSKMSKLFFEKAEAYKSKRDNCNNQIVALRNEIKKLTNPYEELKELNDATKTAKMAHSATHSEYLRAKNFAKKKQAQLKEAENILSALLEEIGMPKEYHHDYSTKSDYSGSINFYFPAVGDNHGHITMSQNGEITYCRLPKKSILRKLKEWLNRPV